MKKRPPLDENGWREQFMHAHQVGDDRDCTGGNRGLEGKMHWLLTTETTVVSIQADSEVHQLYLELNSYGFDRKTETQLTRS